MLDFQPIDQDEHFLISLSPDYSGRRHPDAEIYIKKGIKNEKQREELTGRLFGIFRRQCFKEEVRKLSHHFVPWFFFLNSPLEADLSMCSCVYSLCFTSFMLLFFFSEFVRDMNLSFPSFWL